MLLHWTPISSNRASIWGLVACVRRGVGPGGRRGLNAGESPSGAPCEPRRTAIWFKVACRIDVHALACSGEWLRHVLLLCLFVHFERRVEAQVERHQSRAIPKKRKHIRSLITH